MNVTLTVDGKTFIASARQASTIQTLLECQKGGFANVRGYTATSGRVSPETANLTVLTRFSTERLYKRKIAALEAMISRVIWSRIPRLRHWMIRN